jgi:parallel beta-helix repeat protein
MLSRLSDPSNLRTNTSSNILKTIAIVFELFVVGRRTRLRTAELVRTSKLHWPYTDRYIFSAFAEIGQAQVNIAKGRHVIYLFVRAAVFTAFILLATVLNPHAAIANTYYVATTGNDTNPGTQAAPFRTIQHGADVSNPGDTILVNDGTYTVGSGSTTGCDVNIVSVTRSGTSGSPITFQSINKYGAKLSGQNNATPCGFDISANFITVQGFEIFGVNLSGIDVFGSNVIIRGNHIHDIGRYCSDSGFGIVGSFLEGVANVTYDSNIIHDVGRYSPGENGCNPQTNTYQNNDHGIYIDASSNVTVENNILYNNKHGWSVQMCMDPSMLTSPRTLRIA